VERLIEKRLRTREPASAEGLARQLSMSEPSLRRKLRAEGTSLREVRDAIRCRIAVSSLGEGAEPIAALSERLGFSEPSAFTRAFRRWTGHPPSFYRRSTSPA
jgi:AraC-like DNA-binding protein